jgi:hypothetical protein
MTKCPHHLCLHFTWAARPEQINTPISRVPQLTQMSRGLHDFPQLIFWADHKGESSGTEEKGAAVRQKKLQLQELLHSMARPGRATPNS